MADGRFAPNETERIKEIGAWLKQYGESVYGTRGGPYKPEAWGGSCHRGDTVYLHVIGLEKLERLDSEKLERLDSGARLLTLPPLDGSGGLCTQAECLTGEAVSIVRTDAAGTALRIEPGRLNNVDTLIKLTMPGMM
jgi:hypothetical protein